MRRIGFLVAALAAPHAALAQAAKAVVPDAGAGIAQMLLGLGVVLLVLYGALRLLKRLSAPRGAAAGVLNVVAATAVGPRERVLLLEVGDSWLVVGVAPGRVTSLHTLPRRALPVAPPAAGAKDFGAWLRQAMERKREG